MSGRPLSRLSRADVNRGLCGSRKRSYNSEADALVAGDSQFTREGKIMAAYLCRRCGHYHLTSRSSAADAKRLYRKGLMPFTIENGGGLRDRADIDAPPFAHLVRRLTGGHDDWLAADALDPSRTVTGPDAITTSLRAWQRWRGKPGSAT